jgi:hypothetical protein
VRAKNDTLPALVRAMAEFHMKLRPTPGPPEPPSRGVLELLRERQEVVKRLTASKMEPVWSKMACRSVQDRYVDAHWALWNATLKTSDDTVSQAEKAAALLLSAAVNVFGCHYPVWLRGEIEEKAEPLRVTANQCRIAAVNYPRVRNQDAELADSFLRVAEYFEAQWNINVASSPFVVVDRGERDEVRTRVVALATEMQRLYGTSSYGTTAKIASAALEDDTISLTTVREWCKSHAVS